MWTHEQEDRSSGAGTGQHRAGPGTGHHLSYALSRYGCRNPHTQSGHRWTDGRTDGWADGWMDGRTDRKSNGRKDDRTDGRTDGSGTVFVG